jgi:hypothetical protein
MLFLFVLPIFKKKFKQNPKEKCYVFTLQLQKTYSVNVVHFSANKQSLFQQQIFYYCIIVYS